MCKGFLLNCLKWTLRSQVFCIGIVFWFFSVFSLAYFVFILLNDMHATLTGLYSWREMPPKYSARIVEIEMMRNYYVMCGHLSYEFDTAISQGSYFSEEQDADAPVDVLNIRFPDDDIYYITKKIPLAPIDKRSITSTEMAPPRKIRSQEKATTEPGDPNLGSKHDYCTKMMLREMKSMRAFLQTSLKNIFNTINYRYAVAFICADIIMVLLNALFCAACSLLLVGARRKRVSYMLAWIPMSGAALLCDITYWVARDVLTHPPHYYSILMIVLFVILIIIGILFYICCVCLVLQFFYYCFTMDPDMPMYYHKTVLPPET